MQTFVSPSLTLRPLAWWASDLPPSYIHGSRHFCENCMKFKCTRHKQSLTGPQPHSSSRGSFTPGGQHFRSLNCLPPDPSQSACEAYKAGVTTLCTNEERKGSPSRLAGEIKVHLASTSHSPSRSQSVKQQRPLPALRASGLSSDSWPLLPPGGNFGKRS